MLKFIIVTSLLTLGSGLLVFLFPDKAWKKLFRGPKVKHKVSVGASLLFSALFVLGICLVWINLNEAYMGWTSNSWPSAPATIVSSEVLQTSQPRSTGAAWVPDIAYTFVANGREYTGTGIRFGSMESTDREWIEHQVNERFKVGRELVVFYNPDNPSIAVVEKGFDSFLFAYVLLGLVFAGVGAFYVNELYHDWDGSKAADRMASPL
jgi:hypothetical protein